MKDFRAPSWEKNTTTNQLLAPKKLRHSEYVISIREIPLKSENQAASHQKD